MSAVTRPPNSEEEGLTSPRGLGWYGMIFFIASEAVFFANLIAAYLYLRVRNGSSFSQGFELDKTLAIVNTVILLSSSFPMHFAARAIERGNRARTTLFLGLTIVLGTIFISIQAYEYTTNAFGPSNGVFGSTFYTLTGFHGAHVTAGIIFLIVNFFRSLRGDYTKNKHFPITANEMYWHFVDAVWVLLVTLVYLLPS